MIVRIVKMKFRQEELPNFIQLFDEVKTSIAGFNGCSYLQLYKDVEEENSLYTYSIWESEKALNVYRDSDLFKSVWPATKAMFGGKPNAWSYSQAVE